MAGRVSKTDKEKEAEKQSIVAASATEVSGRQRIIQFRGRAMIMEWLPYPHFVPLHKERFEKIAYPILGGVTRSRLSDVFAYLASTAEDLSYYEDDILFGTTEINDEGELPQPAVWNMDNVGPGSTPPSQTVWRSPYQPKIHIDKGYRLPFIMDLAGGDEGLYDDIMQSIAPMIMNKKPDGVIWWVGDGANGKSTLMDAIWRIFPGQLSSITVKRLTDGRDTPSLNGTLANIVKESSEGRIDDTEIYKNIGTHEDFRVHKFHSQDDIAIRGNIHHIFSGNSIPIFNDKGHSARRRTYVIPFKQRFESDPTFEEKTFTPQFFSELIGEMMKYAIRLQGQGYKYKWSGATLAAKADYDTEANNAEEYAKEIIGMGVVGFESFHPIKIHYENWCAEMGYVPLGMNNLRRALTVFGFERLSYRTTRGDVQKHYRIATVMPEDMTTFAARWPGLFTTHGFTKPVEPVEEQPAQAELVHVEPTPKKKEAFRW